MKVGTIPAALAVRGFRAAAAAAGIKKGGKRGRTDLALIVSEVDAACAGVFTRNRVKAAPVLLDMERIKRGSSRGVIVNSGNANACTGERGRLDALLMASTAEEALGLKSGDLLVSSTGVIGVPLPIGRIRKAIPALAGSLRRDGFPDAVRAIMTTDAFPKAAVARGRVGGAAVTVAGIAKGAGMICPDMATMLAYFMTDANIKGRPLKAALKGAVEGSFNSIIVDNDTSTNDTALIFANALAGGEEIKEGSAAFKAFLRLLEKVSLTLAQMIVRDGEGAGRFIEVEVGGAATPSDARRAARAIASSQLVKTAFFGGDPNWGRILAAVGYSGSRLVEGKSSISLNGVEVVKNGVDTGRERAAARAIRKKEVRVRVRLGAGAASSTVWTTDLGHEYVRINSAYRT